MKFGLFFFVSLAFAILGCEKTEMVTVDLTLSLEEREAIGNKEARLYYELSQAVETANHALGQGWLGTYDEIELEVLEKLKKLRKNKIVSDNIEYRLLAFDKIIQEMRAKRVNVNEQNLGSGNASLHNNRTTNPTP